MATTTTTRSRLTTTQLKMKKGAAPNGTTEEPSSPPPTHVTSKTVSHHHHHHHHHLPNQRVRLATKEELERPDIAWPTILVAVVALSGYLYPMLSTWHNPTWKTLPLSALSVYWCFTPLHDAVHWAISTKHRWINELVGKLAAIPMLAPLDGFRYCHLQHHKFTNDPEEDPDTWSAYQTSLLLQLLAWGTQSYHYVYFYVKHTIFLKRRPWSEAFLILSELSLLYAVPLVLIYQGFVKQALYFIIIPRFLGEAFLAYSFDYVPHRPNNIKRSEDVYGCTSHTSGLLSPDDGAELSWLLLYQNYHNIHHLYPMVPFYRYKRIWDNHKEELIKLGTPFTSWFGPVEETHTKAHLYTDTDQHEQQPTPTPTSEEESSSQ